MGRLLSSRMFHIVRNNAWWTIPQLALLGVLGAIIGFQVWWLIYVAANVTGVWLYCDGQGPRRLGRQRWLKAAAIPLLPVGLVAAIAAGKGGFTPSESATAWSQDSGVRKTDGQVHSPNSHGMGSGWGQ